MEIDKSKSLEEQFKNKIYPVLLGRDQKFPEGESPNDLQARAEQAIEELIMPHVWESAREGHESAHIAVVSHGLCISELVAALMHKGVTERSGEGNKWKGLLNTAWTRAVIEVQGLQPGQKLEENAHDLPPVKVRVTDFNSHEHLTQLNGCRVG